MRDVRDPVMLADFHRSGAVGTVVNDQHLFMIRHQGIDAHINVESSGAAEEDRSIFLQISVDDLY